VVRGKVANPSPTWCSIPKGAALWPGTADQTRLSGSPVKGPLLDFASAVNDYLKTHLFSDIFESDNLGWQRRDYSL
jgi:hypothetical protein